MRRLGVGYAVAVVVSSLVLAACGGDGAAVREASRQAVSVPEDATEKDFHPGNFSNSTRVTNRWYPLVPGTQYVLEGRANRGKGRLDHRVVFTVTDLTKVINGVRTVVLWDQDLNAGEIVEAELAFHAQDDDGNVWNLGEYPEEYEDGKFTGAPDVWIAGLEEAKAGVLMRAVPRVGTSSYLQGFAPEIEFSDRAKVAQMGQKTCVPAKCYEDVLVTDEWNPLEPADAHQLKYYAPGVGNVRVGAAGGKELETLELVEVSRLNAQELAEAREAAMALERRAYTVSRDLYGRTPPVEHPASAP